MPGRRRRLLSAVVRDLCDGVHSLGELDFAGLCRAAGLTEPTRQVVRTQPGGRVYLDVVWEDLGLVVEIDGGHHALALNVVDDALRQNEVVLGDERVLRCRSSACACSPSSSWPRWSGHTSPPATGRPDGAWSDAGSPPAGARHRRAVGLTRPGSSERGVEVRGRPRARHLRRPGRASLLVWPDTWGCRARGSRAVGTRRAPGIRSTGECRHHVRRLGSRVPPLAHLTAGPVHGTRRVS